MKIISSCEINIDFMEGILLVLTKLGHDCIIWNKKQKPFFNMLDEQKPDILFLTPNEHKYSISNKKTKIIYIGKEKGFIQPDLQITPIPYANSIKYNSQKKDQTYQYDIVYFSDYQIDLPKLQLLKNASKIDIKFGIFGKVRLPFYEYCGIDLRNERSLLLNNCIAGIDFYGNTFLDFAFHNKYCFTFFDNPIFLSAKTIDKEELKYQPIKVLNTKEYIYDNKLTDCHITSLIFERLGCQEISKQCLNLLG